MLCSLSVHAASKIKTLKKCYSNKFHKTIVYIKVFSAAFGLNLFLALITTELSIAQCLRASIFKLHLFLMSSHGHHLKTP